MRKSTWKDRATVGFLFILMLVAMSFVPAIETYDILLARSNGVLLTAEVQGSYAAGPLKSGSATYIMLVKDGELITDIPMLPKFWHVPQRGDTVEVYFYNGRAVEKGAFPDILHIVIIGLIAGLGYFLYRKNQRKYNPTFVYD